jgi:Protein of unknown function (DUF3570)
MLLDDLMDDCPQRSVRSRGGLALLIGLLASWPQRAVRAEDSLSYKYEDYEEAAGRIGVKEQAGAVSQDLTPEMNLKLTGTLDAITGATPTGQPAAAGSDQVPLTKLTERRKEWTGDLSRQFSSFSIDAGFADSRESDYVSSGWSVNSTIDFNQKNTTLLLGAAGTSDRVEVFFEPAYLPKHSGQGVIGLTQLLDPLTSVSLTVTWGRATGYLGEQHKQVEKTILFRPGISLAEAFGENRPDEKDHGSALLALNRAFPALAGALEGSYRFYRDTFGVTGHTLEASWYQHIGSKFALQPSLRFYDQTAARFYYYNLDATAIIPVHIPNGQGPFYSSDYRLSALNDYSLGAKAIWTLSDRLELNLAFERYQMRGRDSVTPQSAYPLAAITTIGAKFSW